MRCAIFFALCMLSACVTTLEFGEGETPCDSACIDQIAECSVFDGALCQRQCATASDVERSAFVACAEDFFSSSECNASAGTSCFAMLVGGTREEARCKATCTSYSLACFADDCEFLCGARLPEDNEAFITCADLDVDCNLGCY